jgi:hypothetical protein
MSAVVPGLVGQPIALELLAGAADSDLDGDGAAGAWAAGARPRLHPPAMSAAAMVEMTTARFTLRRYRDES